MDIRLHQISHRGVNLPMARNPRHAAECIGDDAHAKVTVSAGCTCVPGMHVTLVLYD